MDRMVWRPMALAALGACGVLAFYYSMNVSVGLYMGALSCFNACIFLLYTRYVNNDKILSQRALTIIMLICFLSLINVSSILSIFSFENYMSGERSVHNFEYEKLIHITFNLVIFIFAVSFLFWSLRRQANTVYNADAVLASLHALFPEGAWAVTEQGYRGHLPNLGDVALVADDSGWRGVCGGGAVEGCFSAPNAVMKLADICGHTNTVST